MKLKVLSGILALLSLTLACKVIHDDAVSVQEFDKGVLTGVCTLAMMQKAMWTEDMSYLYCECMVRNDADKVTTKQEYVKVESLCVNKMITGIRDADGVE